MREIYNDKLKTSVFIEVLDNGMKVFIAPKKGIKMKTAYYVTKFGSIDNKYLDNDGNYVEIPDGMAHFFEHKLFENENGVDSGVVLSSLGVSANAYTTNECTAYHFEGTDNFYEALDELMYYVQNPYFTDENIKKEQGIIGQEIDLYSNYPEKDLYDNLMKALFHKNEVKINVAGTKETIAKTTIELLYNTYNTFYNPKNIFMVIVGDFEPEKILSEIKKRISKENIKPRDFKVKRIYEEELDSINLKEIEEYMDVEVPKFVVGIKDNIYKKTNDPKIRYKMDISVYIALCIIFASDSDLTEKLKEKGYITNDFSYYNKSRESFSYTYILNQSKKPYKVYDILRKALVEFGKEGIKEKDFKRVKKMLYGADIRNLEKVDCIADEIIDSELCGYKPYENANILYDDLDLDFVNKTIADIFKEEKMVISVIRRKNEKDSEASEASKDSENIENN